MGKCLKNNFLERKKMKTNENGRSMIEMLGVLAIIGVLSVGGIYGYTTAMRKYKANEIVQTASMLATIAKSANAGSGMSGVTPGSAGLTSEVAGVNLSGMTADGSKGYTDVAVVTLPTAVGGSTGDLGKVICSIAPKDTAATAAGYYISECGS